MREIINQQQSLILACLAANEATTNEAIYTSIGLKEWTYAIQMTDLRERALVSWTRCGRNPQLHFAINEAGLKALSDYKERSKLTYSSKVNLMAADYPQYRPKK